MRLAKTTVNSLPASSSSMGYEREMSARQKALELVKRRDAIEAEMDAIHSSLTVRNDKPTGIEVAESLHQWSE